MPATTPIYAFPYPCPGEVVGPGAFMNLANAIDSKLLELAADESETLNRPNARRQSAATNATNSVLTVTVGAGSSFVIPVAGVWLVSAFVPLVTGAGVMNEIRLRVRQNTVVRFGHTRSLFFLSSLISVSTFGALVCAAGDTIDTDFFYTGTLNVNYTVILDLKMIVRIP